LAHLFFFDGEQIERMADEDAARELLASAFQSLLGLDLVGRLKEDLSVLERRKAQAVRQPKERERIQMLEEEEQNAEIAVANTKQELAAWNSAMERQASECEQLREEFRNKGGDLVAQRQTLETDRGHLAAERSTIEQQIREIAAGPAPLLMVADLLKEVR